MNELSAQERIQIRISHWINKIQDLEKDLVILETNSPDYQKVLRVQREYIGRVLAARFFEHVLGFNFETNYNRID